MEMTKVLFATTNPAKVKRYKEILLKKGIELITLQDIDVRIDVEETGENAIENARLKSRAYYNATKIPTIGMDNALFLSKVRKEEQPGTHVRRVNGKTLNDQEMIDYYSKLIKKYGGILRGRWVYGMVVTTENGDREHMWSRDNFFFIDKPCKLINPGYPLDSLAVSYAERRYLAYLAKEKEKCPRVPTLVDKFVIDFIVDSVK